jgi:3-oxoacyl-[acyl-carrier protein] reductase
MGEPAVEQGLSGKRVVVTGGTRGIGRAVVLAFARAGAQVTTCYRDEGPAVRELASQLKEIGPDHLLVRADVTRRADVVAFAQAVRAQFGQVDVLVNNVGVDGHVWLRELDEDEWHRVVDHNLTATYLVIKGLLESLADGASVINLGSSAALRGRVPGVHYTASKAALIGLTRGLCKELGPRSIRVNTIAPGLTGPVDDLPPEVVTRIAGMTALGRICEADDVAGAVLFLAGDTSRYISGATLNVDGGI